MTTQPPNLLKPSDCDTALPLATVVRHQRFYETLAIVASRPAPAGKDDTRANNLVPIVATPTAVTLSLLARPGDPVESVAGLLGGVPAVALHAEDFRRMQEPLITTITVPSLSELVRGGNVPFRGKTAAAEVTPDAVRSLQTTGRAVLQVTLGNEVYPVMVVLKDGPETVLPLVTVTDAETAMREGVGLTAAGQPIMVKLATEQRVRLGRGEAALSEGAPGGPSIVVPESGALPGSGPMLMRTSVPGLTNMGSSIISSVDRQQLFLNEVDVQPPTLPDLGDASLALVLPYEQTWTLIGYERGELISAISLIPQEETTIEVFSWDRRKSGVEDTIGFESEQSSESQSVNRDSEEILNEMSRSGEFTWGASASLQYSAKLITVNANTEASAKLATASTAKTTQNHLHEQTSKAAERVKSSRQTKITESAEFGSETRTTRRLRNANQCHAVTYYYFEILRRYQIVTECLKEEAGLVLLTPFPKLLLTELDFNTNDTIRHEEGPLRRALLDRSLAPGFEAARLLWRYERACCVLCGETCTCPGDPVFGVIPERAQFEKAADDLARALNEVLDLLASSDWNAYFDQIVPINASAPLTPPPGGLAFSRAWISVWAFVEAWRQVDSGGAARLLGRGKALSQAASEQDKGALRTALGEAAMATDQDKLAKAVGPDDNMKKTLLDEVKAEARKAYANRLVPVDTATAADIAMAVVTIFTGIPLPVGAATTMAVISAADLEVLAETIASTVGANPGLATTDDRGIAAAVTRVASLYSSMVAAETAGRKTAEADARADRETRRAAMSSNFPPATVLDAQERKEALSKHLTSYWDHYAYEILMDRRTAGLDVRPPLIVGLGGAVESAPTALIDGKVAYRVDLDAMPGARALLDRLITDEMPAATPPDEFTLPAEGMLVEPRLSSCSACDEYTEDVRRLDLRLRAAQAAAAEFERDRLEARIKAGLLEDSISRDPSVRVHLDQAAPPEPLAPPPPH